MTIERSVIVPVPLDTPDRRQLVSDMRAAAERAAVAMPGDRLDVVRFEALATQLERLAQGLYARNGAGLQTGASTAEDSDEIVDVEIRLPFSSGSTRPPDQVAELAEVAATWRALAEDGSELAGAAAVAERFTSRLRAAAAGLPGAHIAPSNISNRVLTEGLRATVQRAAPPGEQVKAPVLYQDGSAGPPFRLRCLDLHDHYPSSWRQRRFAMLSIRHTEMDAEVDGAWLRNADISRPRPGGDTDRLVYEVSREQLAALTADGPIVMFLYQTGLEAAVVGIYRAVTEHLLAFPQTLAVVPMYFRRQPPDQCRPEVAGYQQQAAFKQGRVWATA